MWTDGLTDGHDEANSCFFFAFFRTRLKKRKSIILSAVFVYLKIEFLLYGEDNKLRAFIFVVWNRNKYCFFFHSKHNAFYHHCWT